MTGAMVSDTGEGEVTDPCEPPPPPQPVIVVLEIRSKVRRLLKRIMIRLFQLRQHYPRCHDLQIVCGEEGRCKDELACIHGLKKKA